MVFWVKIVAFLSYRYEAIPCEAICVIQEHHYYCTEVQSCWSPCPQSLLSSFYHSPCHWLSTSLPARVRHAGYVVLQFLPVCLTCHDKPQTKYVCANGKLVEYVLPYNTIMTKKAGESRRGLGAEDKWADTDVHYQKVKNKHKSLTDRNWKAAMDNAQKVRDLPLTERCGREPWML